MCEVPLFYFTIIIIIIIVEYFELYYSVFGK